MSFLNSLKSDEEFAFLYLVRNFKGSESIDYLPSLITKNYTLKDFISFLTNHVQKDISIIAKVHNDWYLFYFDILCILY